MIIIEHLGLGDLRILWLWQLARSQHQKSELKIGQARLGGLGVTGSGDNREVRKIRGKLWCSFSNLLLTGLVLFLVLGDVPSLRLVLLFRCSGITWHDTCKRIPSCT